MKISIATADNIAELHMLWKISFNCDLSFLSLYFNKGFSLSICYIALEEGMIVSTLSIFPLTYIGDKNINGGYVYGVCTHPDYRGKGFARKLLTYAEEKSENGGLQFLVLRPAIPSLFGLYSKLGFSQPLYRNSVTFPLSQNSETFPALIINGERMLFLRKKYLKSNYFEWNRPMSNFILSYLKYSKGLAVELDNERYMIGVPNEENPKIFEILEAGTGDDGDFKTSVLRQISNFVKSKNPHCNTLKIYFPLYKQYPDIKNYYKEAFVLYKHLGYECAEEAFFNFSME